MALELHQILRRCGLAISILVNITLITLACVTAYKFWWSSSIIALLHIGFSPTQHLFGWVITLELLHIFVALLAVVAALWFNQRVLLLVYTVFVLLLFVMQMVLGTFGQVDYLYREKNDGFHRKNLIAIILKKQNSIKYLIDFQVQFDCCAIESVEEYLDAEGDWPKTVDFNTVPDSCCAIPNCDSWMWRYEMINYKRQGCYSFLKKIYFANLGKIRLRLGVLYGFLAQMSLMLLWMCQDWYFDYYDVDEKGDSSGSDDNDDY